jgi:phosphoribosyl-AMP cyclohydrolase
MNERKTPVFASRGSKEEIEAGLSFQPKFASDGLIPAIVTDAGTGEVLMFAWMNETSLALTVETRVAHFWSRSRKALWRKGAETGNVLNVVEMLTDCDQDVVWLRVNVEGDGLACHTGRRSCFYRSVPLGAAPSSALRLSPVKGPAER